MGVSITPGITALMAKSCPAMSTAIAGMTPASAALLATYASLLERAVTCHTELRTTPRAGLESAEASARLLSVSTMNATFTSKRRRRSAGSASRTPPAAFAPWAQTTPSKGPFAAATSAQPSADVSTVTAGPAERPATSTSQPAALNSTTIAEPRAPVPPKTRARLTARPSSR